MKSTEEIAESVFRRRDKYIIERRKQMKKTVSVLSCFCIVVLLGVGVWHGGWLPGNESAQEQEGPITGDMLPGEALMGDATDEVKRPAPAQEGLQTEKEDYPENNVNIGDKIESSTPSTTTDRPVTNNSGDTGALIAYDKVWGGSYMDQDGRWVILLTENTPENQQAVFNLNPTLSEDNAVFKTAIYSRAYLVDLMEELSSAKLPTCVNSIGFQEDLNRVVVYMTSEDADSIEKVLAFDSIGGAIAFQLLPEDNVVSDVVKGPMP